MRIVVRIRRARSRLNRYLGISVGAHCAALVVVLVVPFLRPKSDLIPMDATFDVELTSAAPGPASSGPRATAPPEPRPAPPPEGPHAVEKIPDPPKKTEPKPKEPKKQEPPSPPTPQPAPPGPPGPATPGTGGPTGSTAGAAGITSLEGGDPGLASYNAVVAGALENAWTKPVLEGVSDVQSVIVTFEIGRDGNVFNLAIDVTSGIASLDRSALRAVQDAAPFPTPPPTARGSSVRERVRFDLRPDAH